MDKAGSFIKGLIFGAVVGTVAGVLLAPKAGKETREDLLKLAKKVKDQTYDYFEDARDLVTQKVEALKAAGKKIDEQKYFSIIGEVIDEFKNDKSLTLDAAKRLGAQLRRDWKKVQLAMSPEVKSTAKISK
ncbi:MAG: hypothetical protein UT34_C0001G0097 [candidate division WS6 bacterium GW2011_GWF2_39_15]|uniref:General stress protein n=1 Tax=candidate division WS6 bacterium GW2011_GWF2_39_15 TaxID=1619100 RepID=A0A0G0QWN6_9BACT|nr:MAG: hypothetical protein UT34_C0001G0097 [candidate division WS6 bacterium GW2011_GWF2_39_15]